MTNFSRKIPVANFHVQLRKCGTVLSPVVPRIVIAGATRVSKRLHIWTIGTIDVINTSPDIQAARSVDGSLSEQPSLLKLQVLWVAIEVVAIETAQAKSLLAGLIGSLQPAASGNPVALTEQLPRVSDTTIAGCEAQNSVTQATVTEVQAATQ